MKRFSPSDVKPENSAKAQKELEVAWQEMNVNKERLADHSVQVWGSTISIADFIVADLEANGWFCAPPYYISDQRENFSSYSIQVFAEEGQRDQYVQEYRNG